MSTPDAATIAALGAQVVRPPFLAWLDIVGDPVRVTTWETSLSFADTGDADLDGHEFLAVSPTLCSVSPVKRQTGGADTVTASLSGIAGPDDDLLDVLADESRWLGRRGKLWFLLLDEDRVTRIGGVVPYFSGKMLQMPVQGSATAQTVQVRIESYLAALVAASNRRWLDQGEFDPADTSAALSISVANGAKSA